ncbi:MAG: F0F1 ATP synthase subunit gamma [Prevotella sp.]|nr:F0F1 ATP synthase subunit gamma [Candidatus Prevotella equi]
MASLKEIKNRIASVQSTRKITSAMKMVASSKLHHAQVMIENMLPYENLLETMLKSFLAADVDARGALTENRKVKKVALLVFASNSSLCGGFNANVLKMMQKLIDCYTESGVEVLLYPIGRKVAEKVNKLGLPSAGNFNSLADKPNSIECAHIGRSLMSMFEAGEIDKVEMIYHHFKSAGSQILTTKTLFPIDVEEAMDYDHTRDLKNNIATGDAAEYLERQGGHQALEGQSSGSKAKSLNDNFIVEPDRPTVLSMLIPRYVNLMVYTALLDSNASEHAARMVAMQTATDNADELLRILNLQYNKSRQQAITSELLDIMGGSVNN